MHVVPRGPGGQHNACLHTPDQLLLLRRLLAEMAGRSIACHTTLPTCLDSEAALISVRLGCLCQQHVAAHQVR